MSNIYLSLFQAEEEYNEAKSVYTKLHAELYEELPALFDRLELLQLLQLLPIFFCSVIRHTCSTTSVYKGVAL